MIAPLGLTNRPLVNLGGVRAATSVGLQKATAILSGVAGDLFRKGATASSPQAATSGTLSSPTGLAQRLVSKFAPALSTLSPSNLLGRLGQATGVSAPRSLTGASSTQSAATANGIVVPSLGDRGAPLTIQDIFGPTGTYSYPTPNTYNSATNPYGGLTGIPGAVQGYPYPAAGTSSVSPYSYPTADPYTAAAQYASSPYASTASAATASTASAATAASAGGDFESGLLSSIQGPPPMPGNVKDERQMLEYQRAMQLYTAMVQMVTQVMQMLHEARKNIIQNLRA